MSQNKYVYLACPYSHDDRAMRAMRFAIITRLAGDYMKNGEVIFSPITHSHPIAVSHPDIPELGWDFWEKFDRVFLSHARLLRVVKLPGWETSVGVQAEIKIATELNLPIEYVEVK